MKKGIYKLHVDVGRYGVLEGIFVAYKLYVDVLLSSKVVIYYGEVLGKHSEISSYVEPEEIKLITDDKKVIKTFEKYNLSCGYNPFEYETIHGETVFDYIKQIIENE